MRNVRVLLIGGTSHAGKSTLAQALAARLGWEHLPTDCLARHPGRPWQQALRHFRSIWQPTISRFPPTS